MREAESCPKSLTTTVIPEGSFEARARFVCDRDSGGGGDDASVGYGLASVRADREVRDE